MIVAVPKHAGTMTAWIAILNGCRKPCGDIPTAMLRHERTSHCGTALAGAHAADWRLMHSLIAGRLAGT